MTSDAKTEGGRVLFEKAGALGVIIVDNPPVNAGSAAVRAGIIDAVAQLAADSSLKAGLLIGAGKTFISGSDIREFGKPIQPPLVPDVIAAIEACPKAIVAAISGAALGGGYEIALACDGRVMLESAFVGLPETRLGLIPGAGGTQRLPRLIGLEAAIDIICSGRRVPADEAFRIGMVDAIVADLRSEGGAFALSMHSKRRLRERNTPSSDPAAVSAAKAKALKAARGLDSVQHALRALDMATSLPIDEALRRERAIFDDIRTGEEATALRHLFFAEREAAKVSGSHGAVRDIASVAVIGAGTMGAAIALCCAQARSHVVLMDEAPPALERARAFITKEDRSGNAAERITYASDLTAVTKADLVIEAIIEDMGAKQELLSRIAHFAPGALIASNTSYLDLNSIAQASGRAQDVIGLHFFNPAHRMKLLEVVQGADTSNEALATALSYGRRLGKICVVARVGEGFIGNRIYNAYRRHCEFLVEDGAAPEEVDAALRDFGFAMGPFAVGDLSGLDIAWRMRQRLAPSRDPRERYVAIPDRLCEAGRLGRKSGAGWYAYDEASPTGRPDQQVNEIIEACARDAGVQRKPITQAEIISRALGAIINEACLVLSEGVARRPSDIDLVLVHGYGFPASKGGPLFWAKRQEKSFVEACIAAAATAQGFGFREGDLRQMEDDG
jgi:3-hydroxyacyl-CoA dehydrogenase